MSSRRHRQWRRRRQSAARRPTIMVARQEESACGQCPDNSLHPRRNSVTAAWWQIRHPLVSVRLHPGSRAVHLCPSSSAQSARLTVAVCVRRVPVREGSRVCRPGKAQGCLARGPLVVLGDSLCAGTCRRAALAPPVGGRAWDEVRDASTFGPIAPQSAAVPGITSPADPAASEPHSEDCLSLNVWTPELPESPTAEPGRGGR